MMKIFKFKKDKIELFKQWSEELNTNLKEEATLSLKEENCTREIFKLFEINGDFYIAAHMEGNNIIPSNKEREINRKHKEIMKECIDKEIETRTLYDIKV